MPRTPACAANSYAFVNVTYYEADEGDAIDYAKVTASWLEVHNFGRASARRAAFQTSPSPQVVNQAGTVTRLCFVADSAYPLWNAKSISVVYTSLGCPTSATPIFTSATSGNYIGKRPAPLHPHS
jgi:hypothetical protein